MALQKIKVAVHQPPHIDYITHPGYDVDDIKKELGSTRYTNLLSFLAKNGRSMFSCGHRVDAKNVEVLGIYERDYSDFIASGG